MKEEVYRVHILCRNCGQKYVADIKKGCTVSDYIFMRECPHCGCHRLEHDWIKDYGGEE